MKSWSLLGMCLALLLGLVAGWGLRGDGGDAEPTLAAPENEVATSTPVPSPVPTAEPAPTASPVPAPTPADPVVVVSDRVLPTFEEAAAIADALSPTIVLPSDCGLPLDEPASLPNADRAYRNGVHQGVDFICLEPGRDAVAALPGRVVVAVRDYVDATPDDRDAVLAIAAELDTTPPWTLTMLYGNHVVLDHGIIDGVGHVVTVHAHLQSVDPALSTGAEVAVGARLGEIGNLGTAPAAEDVDDPRSLHLHWELYVDDQFLGAGLGVDDTRDVYQRLFDGVR